MFCGVTNYGGKIQFSNQSNSILLLQDYFKLMQKKFVYIISIHLLCFSKCFL